MMLTRHLLQQKIALLEPFSEDQTAAFAVSAARELLLYMDKIEALEKLIATPVTLPYCSASPVCEIEAGLCRRRKRLPRGHPAGRISYRR